jgi:hypothetical protein
LEEILRLIIDKFEGSLAVCEDENGETRNITVSTILGLAKESYVIEEINGVFYINEEETEKRRKYIEELTKDMWN